MKHKRQKKQTDFVIFTGRFSHTPVPDFSHADGAELPLKPETKKPKSKSKPENIEPEL